MTSVARTKSGHLEKKSNFRKLPVTVNLQALREKLETSNGKLLEAERRKIVNLELENERLRKSLEVLQRIVDAKNEEIDKKNSLLNKLLEKGFNQPCLDPPREITFRDNGNVEDLDIESLLRANLDGGEVNFDILDLSQTGNIFQSEDGDDFYEAPLDLVTPSTSKDKAQPQPLPLYQSTLKTLPNRDDGITNTTEDINNWFSKIKEDPTVIQRLVDQHCDQKKVTPLKLSSVLKRVRGSEEKIESVASPAKKRRIDFSSSLKCPHCDKQFPLGGQWKVRKHILQEHEKQTKKQAIVCEMCNKTFHSQSVYLSHSEMHRVGNPWNCNLCKRQFGELPLLVDHAKMEHNIDKAGMACKIVLN